VRWQVIDSPGILDHSLEERNTIEMQAVTALAHLKACVLFFIDISETCGQTIAQQISLFKNIKPLFANKPYLIVLTKIDLARFEDLNQDDQQDINRLLLDNEVRTIFNAHFKVKLISLSNKSGEGI
jgi:nucleolar GTP-binding protein